MPALVVELVPNPISTREEHEQHMVLMVKYLIANDGSNEEWILDVVGCRYGFQDLLIPSWRYMHNNARQLVNQCSYNGTEMRDLDLIYRDQSGVQSQAWQETLAFERRARGFFAAFVDKWASKDILNGSDGEFEEQTDEFVRVLKVCVLPVVI